jgi:hypothetical protein
MNERITISFVVFGVLECTDLMVDYTERRKTERERKVCECFPITSPAALQHREKKDCVRKKNF